MAMFVQTITGTQVLAALTTDTTKWAGADIEPPKLRMLDYFGAPAEIALTTTAGVKAFGDLTLPAITGLTIEAAYIGIYVNTVYNSAAAANSVDGSANFQVKESVSGSWTTGMAVSDNNYFSTASTFYPVGVIETGQTDVSAEVAAFDKTYNFQITSVKSVGNNLALMAARPFLRLFVK